MRRCAWILAALMAALAGLSRPGSAQAPTAPNPTTFLGFDRNEYPGDENLAALRQTFDYAGFWLNNPPGAQQNTWAGKRMALLQSGFGFLVLFNGRLDAELKRTPDAAALGDSDARQAAQAARREGFGAGTVIFLDLEEGGRMLPEQKTYIHAWVEGVAQAGYRAGVYCSGIPAAEGHGVTVVTAEDIRQNAGAREIVYWVANDACPPSPGCVWPRRAPAPSESGVNFAEVWQFAQSPRRRDIARGCRNYQRDGNCYAPGLESRRVFVDVNAATSADPSGGRKAR